MFNGIRNQVLFYSWWLIWGAFHCWLLTSLGWNFPLALTEAISSTLILSLFSFSLSFTMRYYRPSDIKAIYLFIWAGVLSIAWTYITKSIVSFLGDPEFTAFYSRTLPMRLFIGLLVMSSFISILYVFFGQLSREEQQRIKQDTERIARETELSTLRDQLQPHFLFNTLNSIHALIGSRPEEARSMIIKLSDFLRNNLKRESRPFITLNEELAHLSLYLDIEKVRFGHRLNVVINSSVEASQFSVPTLLLQPLIENAIKYGLYDTLEDVTIIIDTKVQENSLMIAITNPYDPDSGQERKGTGFGLNSVSRRLFLLYGRQDLFKTESSDKLYKVSIQIPQS